MTDRTTKALLLAIALGLWANVAGAWLKPTPVHAQGVGDLYSVMSSVESRMKAVATSCRGHS